MALAMSVKTEEEEKNIRNTPDRNRCKCKWISKSQGVLMKINKNEVKCGNLPLERKDTQSQRRNCRGQPEK